MSTTAARRVLRGVGVAIAGLLLLAVVVGAGALAYVNTPPGRRLVTREVNGLLASTLKGTIAIRQIGTIGLFGVGGVDATVDDPAGHRVLSVSGARAGIATFAAVRSALLGKKSPLTIDLTGASIESADVCLDTDDAGALELVDAFAPRGPGGPPDPKARGFRLVLSTIALGHGWVHGHIAGAPPLDADLDRVRGALTYAPEALDVDVQGASIRARRIANGGDVAGALQAHLRLPSDAHVLPEVRVAWDGTVGGIAQSIHGSFASERIDAVVDVPGAPPERIRSLWAASPINQSARIHLEAHGPLTGVDFLVRGGIGDGALDADGHMVLVGDKSGRLTFRARGIDVHEIVASAPSSRLGLAGEVAGEMKVSGALSGTASLQFLGGRVQAIPVPPATLHAVMRKTGDGPLQGNAELTVEEPGAPTHLDVRLEARHESTLLHFELASQADDLQKVPPLESEVAGNARLSASGDVDLTKQTIAAQAHLEGADIVQASARAGAIAVDGTVYGRLAEPDVAVTVHAQDAQAAGLRFTSADAAATGAAMNPHVRIALRGPDTADLDAQADVAVQGGVAIDRVAATVAQGRDAAHVTVRAVRLAGGDLTVDDARIDGLGAPLTASVSLAPGAIRVRATTAGFDLTRAARLARIEKKLQGGLLTLDTNLRLQRGAGEGRLLLNATDVSAVGVKNASVRADLSIAERSVVGSVHADAPDIGTLDVAIPKATLAGAGPLAVSAWREAFGAVDVDLRADLAKLVALVPAEDLPFSEASGTIALKAHVARDGPGDLTPAVSLDLDTDKLVLAPRVPVAREIDGVLVHPAAPWRLADVDFTVHGAVDGKVGALQVSTTARDTRGPLATLDASSKRFPFEDLLRHPGRLSADVRRTDLDVKLTVPERGLGSLPPLLSQRSVTGRVQATVAVQGTLRVPAVDVTIGLRHGSFAGNVTTKPLDAELTAHYDGRHATGSVKVQSEGQERLDLETQVDAVAAQFLDDRGATPPWTASARAHMSSFPLEAIAFLDDKLVAGGMSGDVTLAGLHEDGRLDAHLTIDSLSVGSVPYKSATVVLQASAHRVDGTLRIDQVDGFAEAKAHAATSWGAKLVPTLDATKPLEANLESKNLRIAALMPFVDNVLDEIDGRVDAHTHIELDPRERAARLDGTLSLTRGTFEAAAGGGELHDVTASVRFAPDGTVTLEKLAASGMSGKLQAVGSARLQGTSLQSAHATITIPAGSSIPLTVGGTELGDVAGRIDVSATGSKDGRPLAVKVDVPSLQVKVSDSATSTPQVLQGFPSNVRVGAHRGDPARFVLLPMDPGADVAAPSDPSKSGVAITAHLADVHVVRGTQLKVDLTGNVDVSAGSASKVSGQIQLKKGGTLDVEGRTFTVEGGTVTFVDDPANPEIVVKAGWTASDGTTVYATFTGPLKTGKVTLSSQPQLPREEIVQLLLFGSAEGKQAQTPSSTAQESAIATAGGEATQPLNHMLNQLGLGAVTAKVDTSESANPKPEVEVQIAKDISLQIAVVLGQPPPGVNPDHTLVTLDWRFLSKWSLATTVGDAGTTIFDLLWQRRY